MGGWGVLKVRSKNKEAIIRLKREKGLTEDELVEYAILKTFGKKKR